MGYTDGPGGGAAAPRRILQVALAGDPPSLDVHQEQTFMVAQPMGPVYNNLIHFDPHRSRDHRRPGEILDGLR